MTESAESYSLRSAQGADLDEIAGVWHSSASLPTVGPAAMPSEGDLRHRLSRELASGWAITVAESEDRIVGFVAVDLSHDTLAELFVRPDRLGEGIGRDLLARAKMLMPRGFTLHTRSANVKAKHFYEREGLIACGVGTHPRSGDPITYYRWSGS